MLHTAYIILLSHQQRSSQMSVMVPS